MDIDFLSANLERQLGWVRAAETRISLIIPLGTALFGSLAAKVNHIVIVDCARGPIVVLALLLIAISLLFAAFAIFPRTNGPTDSVIFFGSIARHSSPEFSNAIRERDEATMARDFISQIHINARIASSKYRWIQRSMIALLGSLMPWGISVSFLY